MKCKFFSINIKKSVWSSLFKVLICSIALFSILTVSTFAADLGDAYLQALIQKPYVFSWMEEDDHVANSTSVTLTGSNVTNPTVADFSLIDNPYPSILNQHDKVWGTQLDFRSFTGSALELINFTVDTEFYLPMDTSFGESTYLTFGVFAMLDATNFVSDIIDELSVSIGDVAVSATRYNIIDNNKLVAFFTIDSSNIQQSITQQKVKLSITFGDWYPFDPIYGEAPYFYLQFGDIIQTISMTANEVYLDNIFALLQGDSSNNQAGADFNDSMQDNASNANGLVDQMNELNKPSMGDIDNLGIDSQINSILNFQSTSWLTNAISVISSFPLISSMAFIGLSVSLISFVFYGKKG